ncbi:amidase family protein [Reyranella sp. CPCC 100927]|uniref:amidase family protein n=1 Tax=Reyranella sp. CPCC 100927 TaxID=2599616 RepID=UPI0011B5CECF|nr:amidase family protein [Reyranella sp. CPCC 100927]TWT11777.1 amidase [Reyranella sp. CPCC 100927]
MNAALLKLDAVQLAAAYRRREVSPVEAARAVLEQAEATQATLNAFVTLDPVGAMAAASAAERRWRDGTPLSAIDGVPVSIKDNVYTDGMPTRFGSKAIAEADTQGPDSPVVARLREAGAVIFGKTTLPDYAHKIVTDSPLTGITRNPWDVSRSPGGSSGGASAAIAAGIGPLAVGTDGGGSIRVPAAWSGIYGFKPSFGRVPHHPRGAFPTVSHVGPMTRTVRDAARMMTVIARPDPRDWYALPYDGLDYEENLTIELKGKRIAFSPDFGLPYPMEPEAAAVIARAVRTLTDLGICTEVDQPEDIAASGGIHGVHWCAFSARLAERLGPRAALLDVSMQALVQRAKTFPPGAFVDAVVARGEIGSRIQGFFARYDLLVGPVIDRSAPVIAEIDPVEPPLPYFTGWCNQVGLPAASVPCGLTRDGLPVGLHIIGGPRADALVLAASHACEQIFGRLTLPM